MAWNSSGCSVGGVSVPMGLAVGGKGAASDGNVLNAAGGGA